MPRPLKKITRYFERNVEARFNPLFKSGIVPGVLVDIDDVFDTDLVAKISEFGVSYSETVPGTATFPALTKKKTFKFSGDAKVDLQTAVPINAELGAVIKNSTTVTMSFGNVITTKFFGSQYQLEKSIRDAYKESLKDSSAAEDFDFYFNDRDIHIVTGIYIGKVTISFEKEGEASFDAKAIVAQYGNAGLQLGWEWTSNVSMQSKEPVTIAYETCKWRRRSQRLKQSS